MMQQMLRHVSDTEPFPLAIPVVRHEAIDGRTLDVDALYRQGIVTKHALQNIINVQQRVEAIVMTRGGLGCYLSHLEIWQSFVDDGEPGGHGDAVLVLEDDVRLSPLFRTTMDTVQLPKEYDIVYLSFPDFGRRTTFGTQASASGTGSTNFLEQPPQSAVQRVLGDNWGTGGYVLSQRGARTLLQHAYPLNEQIDAYLVRMVALGLDDTKDVLFEAYVVDSPVLVRELKSLHRSDVQRKG